MSTTPSTFSRPLLEKEPLPESPKQEIIEEDLHLAHSLRTPLTALKSALEILAQSDLPEGSQHFANMAQRNADRMIELVEQLLTERSVKS